ncbi:MAG: hypothetical protein KA586_07215 [Candidatus Promineofilum sp.]|nr:hypothetical protein [Promineifilum sp.]
MHESLSTPQNSTSAAPEPDDNGLSSYIIVVYEAENVVEVECAGIDEVLAHVQPAAVNWITLRDVHDETALLKLFDFFNIDPFVLNEILDEMPMQFDIEYENCLYLEYVVPHVLETQQVVPSEGAFILGRNFVILYEHDVHRLFTRTRKRLIGRQTKAQRYGADYLLYLLLRAAVVEQYQLSFKRLTSRLEELEDLVLVSKGREEVFAVILSVREEVKQWNEPLLELQDFLEFVKDAESKFISEETVRFFAKDLNREVESLLAYYDRLHLWLKEVMDLHMANVSRNANRVMQLLAVIATIFLPLTFISSVYGMNFVYMPELKHPLGYVFALSLMLFVAVGSLVFMKRRKWF